MSELLRFSKLFNDELTLDNLERYVRTLALRCCRFTKSRAIRLALTARRVQLVSLCRFVGIQPFGTDAFLRSRLRRHLLEIKASAFCPPAWRPSWVDASPLVALAAQSIIYGLPIHPWPSAPSAA